MLLQAPGGGRGFTRVRFQGATRQWEPQSGARSPAGPSRQRSPPGAGAGHMGGRAPALPPVRRRDGPGAPAEVSPYLYLPQAAGSGGRRRRRNPTALPFQGGPGADLQPRNAASPSPPLPAVGAPGRPSLHKRAPQPGAGGVTPNGSSSRGGKEIIEKGLLPPAPLPSPAQLGRGG